MSPYSVLRILNALVAAAIGITAAGLWLYTLTFNLRDRVARAFSLVLFVLVPLYGGEALADVARSMAEQRFWMRVAWSGLALLPAALLFFSDALLTLTGRPSRGRRVRVVQLAFVVAGVMLWGLWDPRMPWYPRIFRRVPAPHFVGGAWTWFFALYYGVTAGFAVVNLYRAFRRAVVRVSRRRLAYLFLGGLALSMGAFPYLTFAETVFGRFVAGFWLLGLTSQMLVGGLLVLMAYAASFFGVTQPDRVVQQRLIRWLVRGPVTASVALAAVTLARYWGMSKFGEPYGLWVPVALIGAVLFLNAVWGVLLPRLEALWWTRDPVIHMLHRLETGLFTTQDLRQFLEALLGVVCDRLQVPRALLAALDEEQRPGLTITIGEWETLPDPVLQGPTTPKAPWAWGDLWLWPIHDGQGQLVALLVFPRARALSEEDRSLLETVTQRILLALQEWRRGYRTLHLLQNLAGRGAEALLFPRLHALARFDRQQALRQDVEDLPSDSEVFQWVRDALKHYWGGPKLTRNPLLRWRVVQQAAEAYNGDAVQGLRAVLREAVERLRPPGERRFTTEWLLYNILEMKFFQGRKVREIVRRLALSEADFYRKQRAALAEVARVLLEMEREAARHRSATAQDAGE